MGGAGRPLLLAGRLGDLIGQRRVFLIGMAIFTCSSLVCAVAPSQEVLIGARFVQGIGGALNSAVVLGMIVVMFPEPREQAKAIGVFGFVASAGGSIGLLLGGVLTQSINWHWIFFINVPLGVVVALAARRLVEDADGIGVQVGGAIGLAVLATFAASHTDALRAGGTPAAAALNGGYHVAYLIGAGLVGVGLLVAATVLEPAGAPVAHPVEGAAEARALERA